MHLASRAPSFILLGDPDSDAFVDPFGAMALPLSGPWEFRVEL